MNLTKQEFLEFWHVDPDSEEGEQLWQQKLAMMEGRHLRRAPMIFVQQDIHYQSPVDGRVITSRHQRLDDLARNNCVEYDPEMKKDYQRRIAESEKRIDRAVDEHVDRAIAQMPARKREKLESELKAGASAEIIRTGPQ